MLSEYEAESILTEKILDKYGTVEGINKDLVRRIGQGTATEHEINTYIEHAPKLVDKFKADMRQTSPDDYSDADIEIIVAMAAKNHMTLSARNETFSKVLPENKVKEALTKGEAKMFGFAASDRYSEHLSPTQIVSQFGLDYTGTPYLMDVDGQKVPVTAVYCMKAPMSKEIRDNTRIPFDPRILDRVKALADDLSRQGEDIQQLAQAVSNKDACMVIAQSTGDKAKDEALLARVKQYGDAKYAVQSYASDAPFTGNSMPQYGAQLEGKGSYSDLIQEVKVTKPFECAAGTEITLKVPRPGVTDPNLPGGSMELKIAEWDGRQWQMVATPEQIEAAHAQALAALPAEAREQMKARLVSHESLQAAREQGATKDESKDLTTPLPEGAGKEISAKASDVTREMLRKLTGDADVAASAEKHKGKKKNLKKEKEEKEKREEEEREKAAQEAARDEEEQAQQDAQAKQGEQDSQEQSSQSSGDE